MAVNRFRVRLGDLSVAFIHNLLRTVEGLGHDSQSLRDTFALSPARLAEPDGRLSIPRYMRLGHAAIQLSGREDLGLLTGSRHGAADLGLAGVLARAAPTLREALACITEYESLYAQNYRGQSSLHEDAQGAWLRFYSISPYNDYNRFVVDSVLAGWASQIRHFASNAQCIERVHIEFAAPTYHEQYAQHFAAPVEFNCPRNQLRLSKAALDTALPEHCPSTWNKLKQIAEREREQRTYTRSMREKVIQQLGPLLLGHEPDIDDVAARLGLPSWTLRRKLSDEGSGFRQLLNETRHDLATTYVRDTDLSFGEIAYLLGFASAGAFQRAFKRWSGSTPGDYRRQQRRG
ncbi:AraC family transcriptional regulator [Atopomonas sediminilitoris]|uniref:AraC family transcriptional regulator n=1 Tax=Atopomonas sediminilitoris TaxID=2919919 RepID=UPI001F4EE66D|nr:AraC family transcriptional regulator [Atopomonas sediminilitoris]MCJ8170802.1 AraC family transcriptional regulator [Atopomonas sediminilitoris]